MLNKPKTLEMARSLSLFLLLRRSRAGRLPMQPEIKSLHLWPVCPFCNVVHLSLLVRRVFTRITIRNWIHFISIRFAWSEHILFVNKTRKKKLIHFKWMNASHSHFHHFTISNCLFMIFTYSIYIYSWSWFVRSFIYLTRLVERHQGKIGKKTAAQVFCFNCTIQWMDNSRIERMKIL